MKNNIIKRAFLKIEKDANNNIKVTSSFPIEITENKDTKQFVCHSPLFTAIGYGSSEQEAQMNFIYSLEDIISSMIESGRIKFNKWMKQMGWFLKENMIRNDDHDKFELKSIDKDIELDNLEIITQTKDYNNQRDYA